MKHNTIITFDYELFLGIKSGTIDNCVIKPTQRILDVLKQNNAKAIFFVDAAWLLFLKKKSPGTLNHVSAQLKEIIRHGSSVELHLHPQWLYANPLVKHTGFQSAENYKLHSLSQDEIIDLFKKSIELIEGITKQKVRCFRAGGFCIEPFDQIKPAFEMFEIKYDFSLAPGMYLRSGNTFDFDFSDAPDKLFYAFENDVSIPEPYGKFMEIPLSTYYNNPVYRISNKVLLKLNKDRITGDGIGIQHDLSFFSRLISKRVGFSKTMLTLDQTSNTLFKYLLKNHFGNTPLLVVISHPKTTSNQALQNLSYLTSRYETLNSGDLDNVRNII